MGKTVAHAEGKFFQRQRFFHARSLKSFRAVTTQIFRRAGAQIPLRAGAALD